MGIAREDFEFLKENISQEIGKDYKHIKMLELGNQHLHKDIEPKYETSKQYFEAIGVSHVSIDINGKDGAIPINLNELIEDNNFVNQFDIVTNFGTTEHVKNQYMCWKNVHRLCKDGGLFVSVVPKNRYWPGHGYYGYKKSFFTSLSAMNNYSIIKCETNTSRRNKKRLINFSAIKKGCEDFITETEFKKIVSESIIVNVKG